MILAHNLSHTAYSRQRVISGKVWFLVGLAKTKREAQQVASRLKSGSYKQDNKSTVWKVRVVPVSGGYLVFRR